MKIRSGDKCCKCKKRQAVAFWPCIDPDIPSHPYCQVCLHVVNAELFFALAGIRIVKSKHKKERKTK